MALNFFAYAIIDVISAVFAFYVYTLIRESDTKFSYAFPILITAICAVDILFLVIGFSTGKIMNYQNGSAVAGAWGPYTVAAPVFCLMGLLVLLIIKAKVLGRSKILALSAYLGLPIVARAVAAALPEVRTSYVACALASLLVYVIIQTKLIDENHPQINGALRALSEKYQTSKCAIATAFLLKLDKDLCVITGSMDPGHIQECLDGERVPLSKEDWYFLYRESGHMLP